MNNAQRLGLIGLVALLMSACGGGGGGGKSPPPSGSQQPPSTPGTGNQNPPPSDPGTQNPPPSDPGTQNPPPSDPGTQNPPPSDPGTGNPPPSDPGTENPPPNDPGTENPPPSDPGTQPPPPPTFGMETRPSNTTCLAPERPKSNIAVVPVFPNVSFDMPTAMVQPRQDSAHWYVTEQAGLVKRFDNKPDTAAPITVLDITANVDSPATGFDELGLLGIAFHPNFATNHYVYLLYSRASTSPRQTWISRFTASNNGASIDPATEVPLMKVNKPSDFHNGGTMHFGPDGYLYIGLGDGGKANDPGNNAQNPNTVLGKMLRIDVDHGSPYAIPADNPNAANPMCGTTNGRGTAACPEIYATGFRNPWKWSFDSGATDPKRLLWMGDVGQDRREEIDLVEKGKNYGWSCREGRIAVAINAERCANVDLTQYTNPILEYDHDTGSSITGGYVYRGSALPDLVGHYIFADYVNGLIWYLTEDATGFHRVFEPSIPTNNYVSSFAEGNDRELYVLTYPNFNTTFKGRVLALRPGTPTSGAGVAQNLSQTGCVDPTDPKKPAAGLIPYKPSAQFWSDGATKERWIALPDGKAITASNEPSKQGDFEFPEGTVLVKNFTLNNQLIETRLFMRHPDGLWAGYTYEWNDAQTDATLVDASGKQKTIGGQVWTYPSQGDCLRCHTGAAGFALGPEAAQLNNDYGYPTGKTANQMQTLAHIGVLANLPDPEVEGLPDPFGTASVDERARAYLHANCSGCHRPNGPTQSNMDLRFGTALADRNVCNADPHAGDVGIANGKLIVPGNANASILFYRMSHRDEYQMPPLASSLPDEKGAALIAEWIDGLTGCQ